MHKMKNFSNSLEVFLKKSNSIHPDTHAIFQRLLFSLACLKNYFEKSNVIIDEPPPILTIWWEALSNHPWEPLPSHPPGLFKDPKEPKTTGVGGHPLVCSPHCHLLTCSLFRHMVPTRGSICCCSHHWGPFRPFSPEILSRPATHPPQPLALGAVRDRTSFWSQGSF